MKENLLVTLADEHFLDQAKQLFSSAYWRGGWRGDYMLLAYAVPEEKLAWFKNKGILVRSVSAPPVDLQEKDWTAHYPPSILAKFYVFTPEFKAWRHVVFLDGDIIVKADINGLAEVEGFNAVTDMLPFIENQIHDYAQNAMQAGLTRAKAFNSGVFSFSTDIIAEETFHDICAVAGEYAGTTIYFPDQAILNIFFHKKWRRLPFFFNLYYLTLPRTYRNDPSKIRCAILHFAGKYKPWDADAPCRREWEDNLRRADAIDLKCVPQGIPHSSSAINPLSIRYLCAIELLYWYKRFIHMTMKRCGVVVGYFTRAIVLGRGWYVPEYHDREKRSFIWNTRQSELCIRSHKVTGVELDIMRSPLNKTALTVEAYRGDSLIVKREYPPQSGIVRVAIGGNPTSIRFRNAVFIPAHREGGSRDTRRLGIMLFSPLIIHRGTKTFRAPLSRVASYKYAHVQK